VTRTNRLPRIAGALLLAIAFAAGIWFRFAGLARLPFWLDEAYSAYAADHGWYFLWHVVPTYETHPPFYYSLLHFWRGLFGDGTLALRIPGALCGVATIGAAAFAGRALAAALALRPHQRHWLVCAMAGLVALHPDLIAMSRDVRPYPVMALVYGAALIPLMRIAGARPALPHRPLAAYALCEALMLWLHSLGPLFAGAMGMALLAVIEMRRLDRRDWAWLAGSQVAAILVWLPAALILRDQAPTWIASTWLVFRPATLWQSLGLLYAAPPLRARWLGLLLALFGLALLVCDRRGRRIGFALGLLAIVPTAASLAITLAVSPVFLTRTLSAVALPALLVMTRGLALPGRMRFAMLLPLAALLWPMATVDRAILHAPPNEDWYGTIRWLAARARPGDELWAYPNESALPFVYAARDLGFGISIRAIPTIVPSIGARGMLPTGSRGVVSLYPDDIARLAASPQAQAPCTIWLLRTGPWTYDKGDAMLNALSRRREDVGDWEAEPIEIAGLRRAGGCPPSVPGRLAAAPATR